MRKRLAAFDEEKISRITLITNELHDAVTCLYEALCDEEDKEAEQVLRLLEKQIRLLRESFDTDFTV